MTLSNTALVTLVQVKNYLRVDAAASLQVYAEGVGVGTGELDEFTLNETPIEGSLKLYVNDALQVETEHYSITNTTITFVTAPPNGHIVTASYDYSAGENTFESYDDNLLEDLIEAATKQAEDYTGRAFLQREIVETHIGDNKQKLKLYKQPVTDVASVTIGGDALTTWSERLSTGRIYHLVVWPLDYEIEVKYTAGYGDRAATQALIPDAVVAVLIAVAFWYENRMGIKSQNIAGVGSVDYSTPGGLPEAAKGKLNSLKVNVV